MALAFPEEFQRLKPLLVTFEGCLLAICELKGYDQVKNRLRVAKGCDGSLSIALGSDGQATCDVFREALLSFGHI